MENETVFPSGTDFRFPFTNRDTEDFTAVWAKKAYTFPAMSTVPMLGMIHDATPLEIQGIRKKFARDWAEKMFSNSAKYKRLVAMEKNTDGSPRLSSFQIAGQYSDADLTEYTQMCLTPLPIAEAQVGTVEGVPLEDKLHRDEDGEILTRAVKDRQPLHKKEYKEA